MSTVVLFVIKSPLSTRKIEGVDGREHPLGVELPSSTEILEKILSLHLTKRSFFRSLRQLCPLTLV